MKVKIKGLVFVGFAAAVFAQSAFAVITPNATTDPKTVTSKKYVDEKIPGTYAMTYGGTTHEAESTEGAVVLGNGYGEVKFTKLSNSANDVNTTNGQDVVVTGKAVADAMAVTRNLQGDILKHTAIENIMGGTNNTEVVGHKVVVPAEAVADTSAKIVNTNSAATGETILQKDKLATAGAVFDYAEATANKLAEDSNALGTTTITQANAEATDGNTKFPTVRNVYDFVKAEGGNYQRKLTNSENALYIGKWDGTLNNGAGDSTWKALEAVSSNDQASTDYVTIKADSNGVYQVNIPAAQIATTAALTGATATNDAGLVTAGSIRETILQAGSTAGGTIASAATAQDNNTSDETVPTTKNVYEFVTNYAQDTYQPKIADGNANTIMIGYNTQTGTGTGATYSSDWKALQGTQYISVGMDNELSAAKIALDNNYIADTEGAIASADGTNTNAAYNSDLTTAAAVHAYVQGLLHGNEIPTMPSTCTTAAASGHYCALVYGNRAAANETPDYGLEWTVMAPAN